MGWGWGNVYIYMIESQTDKYANIKSQQFSISRPIVMHMMDLEIDILELLTDEGFKRFKNNFRLVFF